ncbi:methyltransferase domain-containing protein [Nonomuraea sp. GTA35]|uniref:methyltransferase domain-containing protein n=1 Tax=Nonomuraea sp. GTA35 TaxID=1676746 RepID=UPI0035C01FF8
MDRLIASLDPEERGHISESIVDAVRAVPRHHFIPDVGLVRDDDGERYLIDRQADPDAWYRAVYGPNGIVTQLDDGATPLTALKGDFTSSASEPATVADLLNQLGPEPGHRVLEIGTGTGWTAALLSHLVGGHGEVTSIEVDPQVAEQAAKNLSYAGFHPRLLVGDGALGCMDGEPYDRVHVTCGIREVPYAWVEQCRPGAVIVLPWHPGYGDGVVLRLEVQDDGTAAGRVVGFASYMWMRAQRPGSQETAETTRWYWTALDPRALGDLCNGADLAISALTGLESSVSSGVDDDGEYWRMVVAPAGDPGSYAVATWRPGRTRHAVQQVGDRPVWDEVLHAYARWVSWGEPSWERYGVTVAPDGQSIWLDTPDNVLRRQEA